MRHPNRSVAVLTLLSVALFAVMIPGGPIETRHFRDIGVTAIVAFNTFLTTLGLSSIAIVVFAARGARWVAPAALAAGFAYAAVYALDLLGIFPASPDPMPSHLQRMEIIGLALSLPLMASAIALMRRGHSVESSKRIVFARRCYPLMAMLAVVAGAAIIGFASVYAGRN